jgi:hypothetical protein
LRLLVGGERRLVRRWGVRRERWWRGGCGDGPEEQRAGGLAEPVVGEDVAVLPGDRLQARQHRVALLSRRDEDGGS